MVNCNCNINKKAGNKKENPKVLLIFGGEDGIRTHDLLYAIQAFCQLNYNPKIQVERNGFEPLPLSHGL